MFLSTITDRAQQTFGKLKINPLRLVHKTKTKTSPLSTPSSVPSPDGRSLAFKNGGMKFTAWAFVKRHEKLRLKAYLPTKNDVWTIGYGHTGSDVYEGLEITEAQAGALLFDDVNDCLWALQQYVQVPLSQAEFNALTSFVFNVGAGNFKRSTLLKKLNAGDYQGAADQFPKWIYQKKKKLNGLVKRRKQERSMFLGEEYHEK